jgi:hypothetical protein
MTPPSYILLKRIQGFLSTRPAWVLLVCLFSIIGTILVLYSTVWGAALSDDSYYYISSARNLLAGRGFDLTPIFPPLLPLLLSVVGAFKVDPLISVRWVNAILFGINIFLIAWIVSTLTGSSAFSLLGALLAMVMSTLVMIHSWAMSEALYVSLTLSGLLVYAVTSPKENRSGPILTGLCFGLAAATRYIGVSLLLAGGIFWLTEAGKSSRDRLRNTFWFSLIGLLPLLTWTIRNQILTGRPTSRVFSWHPIPKALWINALNTIFTWLAPGRFVHGKELAWLAGFGLAIFAWLGWVFFQDKHGLIRLWQSFYRTRPIFLICLSILTYWVILIVSRTFFDDLIPMDERLLSPLLVLGLILLGCLFARLWNSGRWPGRSIIMALSLILVLVNLTRSVQLVQSYHQLGRGYSSARDHISETYAYLRNRPNTRIYSNAFTAIYFWTGRVTNPLPPPAGIPAMKTDMRQTGAYLVVFDSIPVKLYGDTITDLTEGLVTQIRLSEATIYRSP